MRPGSSLVASCRTWSYAHGIDLLCWSLIAYQAWFAVHFAEERIHADAAYFLVQLLDRQEFFINHGRWIMPLAQWPAWCGMQLGGAMPVLILLYSLGPLATLLPAFAVVRFHLRDKAAALALCILPLVGLSQALFCPVFEFYHGALLLLVVIAWLRTGAGHTPLVVAVLSVLLFLVLSSHFMAMAVACMSLFVIKIWRYRALFVPFCAVAVLHGIIRASVISDYEVSAINSLLVRFEALGWLWILHPGRLGAVFVHMAWHYGDVLVIIVLTGAVAFRDRRTTHLLLFIGGLLVLYVLGSFYFPDTSHRLYREIVDYPLAVWVVIMAYLTRVFSTFPRWSAVVLVLGLVFRLWLPLYTSTAFVERRALMQDRIEAARAQGIQRGLIPDLPVFMPPWHTNVALDRLSNLETVLLSVQDGPEATVMLMPVSPGALSDTAEHYLEGRLRTHDMPLIWDSSSPYFKLPRSPWTVVR